MPLSLRFSPAQLICCDLLGCVLALAILSAAGASLSWLYAGAALLGASFASIFPCTMSLPPAFGIEMTASRTAAMTMGAAVGDTLVPLATGLLFASAGPASVLVVSGGSIGVAGLCFTLVSCQGHRYRRSNRRAPGRDLDTC